MINKFASNEAFVNTLTAKRAFITAVQAVDLSATRVKGGILSALNGATTFNLNTGALNFNTDSPAIRRVLAGYPTQFVKFATGNVDGKGKAGVTVIGSNRNGSESSNDGGFVGIRAWNGPNVDTLDLVGDEIRFASSPYTNADGWSMTTTGKLMLQPYRVQDRRQSVIGVGDVWLYLDTSGKYYSLHNIIKWINGYIKNGKYTTDPNLI